MNTRLLGIDVGTGGTRAVLLEADGRVVSAAVADHVAISSPHPNWAEQDPHDWWAATRQAIGECLARGGASPGEIAGIGLTGQMHGLVLLDGQGRVLRPAIIWCDQRTEQQARAITERIGAQRLIELTANPALTNFTLTKIWWVQQHEPREWSATRSILLPKDYLRFRLTGALATDVTDASGTLLLDVANRRWSAPMIEASRIDSSLLPRLFESHEMTGKVSAEAARATGLPAGIPVMAGAGDQAAGAVGLGIVQPGAVSATIGTSGVVFAATGKPILDPHGRIHTFCHAAPALWHVMGVTQAAGYSLRWFRDQFVAPSAGVSYDELTHEAAAAPPGSDGLLWAPYLMGERTPHLDPHAKAAFVGITSQHTRAHLIRAIMEGVAFSLRDSLTIFSELKIPVESIRLGGGGARSALWREIQAGIYGMAVGTVEAEEGPAYGAALLAGVGAGVWPSIEKACEAVVRPSEIIQPNPKHVELLNRCYHNYQRLYPALRDAMHGAG